MTKQDRKEDNLVITISGIAGILLGLGMFIIFKNLKGFIPFVIGIILLIWRLNR